MKVRHPLSVYTVLPNFFVLRKVSCHTAHVVSRSLSRVHSNRCNLRLFNSEKPTHSHSSRHLLPFDSSLLSNFTFRPAFLFDILSCRTFTILMSSPIEASDIISLSRLASQSSRRCHTQLSALLELLSQKVRLPCISVLNAFDYLIRIKLILTFLPSFFFVHIQIIFIVLSTVFILCF